MYPLLLSWNKRRQLSETRLSERLKAFEPRQENCSAEELDKVILNVESYMGISIQDMLGAATAIDTNVDVVFVIDGTQSMQPLIDKVKELTISFRNDLEKELSKNQ